MARPFSSKDAKRIIEKHSLMISRLATASSLDERYKDTKNIIEVKTLDWFNSTKSDKKLADKGIRISTTIDNPWILCDLFERIDKSLGQQYVDKSKVELVLDTKA